MKVLILGGDGFIGSHLLHKHILKGDRCIVLDINTLRTQHDNKIYNYIHHDINDGKLDLILKKVKPDLVYNCIAVATPSYYVQKPVETFELDFLLNYQNICLQLLLSKIPFIHFSTSEVYGKKWISKYKEFESNLILGPVHKSRWIYATSKILLEQLLMANSQNEFVIIRPQNFFGWDMDWLPGLSSNQDKKWIPRLPACFMNALFFKQNINVVKPGTQKRCYTHIDDATQGILSIIDNWEQCSKKAKILNIGNPKNESDIYSLAKLYKRTWESITGTKAKKIKFVDGEELYGEGYEDCERRMFSIKRIQKYTGWEPKISLKRGVEKMLLDAKIKYKL